MLINKVLTVYKFKMVFGILLHDDIYQSLYRKKQDIFNSLKNGHF